VVDDDEVRLHLPHDNLGMKRKIKLKRKLDRADRDAPRFHVQLFGNRGMYPRGTFRLPCALFHADEDIAFAVTYGCGWSTLEQDLPYSEADWLGAEVVKLLGAFMMCEESDGIRSRFYPVPYAGFVLDVDALDFAAPSTPLDIKSALLRTVDNRLWRWHKNTVSACGRHENLFDASRLNLTFLLRYWGGIDIGSYVLLRAIQALVKADMLAQYSEFREEATIASFIAMDASHELVLRHLRANDVNSPSSLHAGEWLYRTFDEPVGVHGAAGMKYFEEFYAQRVQTVHPGSRFGDVPFAPVMADDYIHLRYAIPEILGYLVLGEHKPDHLRRVQEQQDWLGCKHSASLHGD
jgi:hypothetical protein